MDAFDLSDISVFEAIYKQHHADLYRYARKYVRDETMAEEIVQELFLSMWQKAQHIQINTAIQAYLYTAVRNRCFNYLKREFSRTSPEDLVAEEDSPAGHFTEEEVSVQELQAVLKEGIDTLPERCRIIFQLSRETGLSYPAIAQELDISVKTVEAQVGTALKRLRAFVSKRGYLPLWLLSLLLRL